MTNSSNDDTESGFRAIQRERFRNQVQAKIKKAEAAGWTTFDMVEPSALFRPVPHRTVNEVGATFLDPQHTHQGMPLAISCEKAIIMLLYEK